MPYIGRQHKKTRGAKELVTLRPGETLAASGVDITDVYQFPDRSQTMTIKYMVPTAGRGQVEVIESPCVSFRWDRPAGPAPKP